MASDRSPLRELSSSQENTQQMTPDSDFYGTKSRPSPSKPVEPQPYLRCEPPGDPETQRQWSERAQKFSKNDFEQSWAFLQNSINAYAHYMNPYVHQINNNPYCHYTASYATFHVPFIHFKELRPYPTQLPTPPLDPSASAFMPPPRRLSSSRKRSGSRSLQSTGPMQSIHVDLSTSSEDRDVKQDKTSAEIETETRAEKPEDKHMEKVEKVPEPTERKNPYEGQRNARQLHETSEDFITRLPPFGNNGVLDWLWVANPYAKGEQFDDSKESADVSQLKQVGEVMLDTYKPVKGRGKIEHLESFKHELLDLASELNVTAGKWMLFVTETHGESVWKRVCQAVIANKLGTGAKIAASGPSRLICIYTKDFDDTEDVTRVLHALRDIAVLPQNGSIYYKPDCFTYLQIYNSNKWGFKSSLYESAGVFANDELKKKHASQKKRSSTGNDDNAHKRTKI